MAHIRRIPRTSFFGGQVVNMPTLHEEGSRTSGATEAPSQAIDLVQIARQSVYDASHTVTAYELLYRGSATAVSANVVQASQATLQVIATAVLEIGLDRLSAGLPVHINFPAQLLETTPPIAAPPERVVIEVLEGIRGSPAVMAGVSALRARGHRVALDDYSPRVSDPALLDVADIVKIDVSQHSETELADLVAALRRRGLTLIAEHVETAQDFQRCIALGFDGFQGFFLQHPLMFSARRVPSTRLGAIRLIALLQNDNVSVDDIQNLLSQDVSLSYQVLRCINSSYYGFPRRIDSIRQAIVILGMTKLQELCALVALRGLDDRPPSLFLMAMTRARMCEQLAALRGINNRASFFVTGLFSMLDALTGIPMGELIPELPLAVPVTRALIAEEGDLGAALRSARAYERGSWTQIPYGGLAPEVISAAYVEAVSWAEAARAVISM
jgi:EAL and modified HD-GYP domain-containing signal transduction protein